MGTNARTGPGGTAKGKASRESEPFRGVSPRGMSTPPLRPARRAPHLHQDVPLGTAAALPGSSGRTRPHPARRPGSPTAAAARGPRRSGSGRDRRHRPPPRETVPAEFTFLEAGVVRRRRRPRGLPLLLHRHRPASERGRPAAGARSRGPPGLASPGRRRLPRPAVRKPEEIPFLLVLPSTTRRCRSRREDAAAAAPFPEAGVAPGAGASAGGIGCGGNGENDPDTDGAGQEVEALPGRGRAGARPWEGGAAARVSRPEGGPRARAVAPVTLSVRSEINGEAPTLLVLSNPRGHSPASGWGGGGGGS